ncbi:MAG: DUF4169 family protein [Hellea sp.]|nr:DUF4169 family protein [Hellea sp.]
MSDDNVIKFGKAKKALNREAKEAQAEANRQKFGRTKAQKKLDQSVTSKRDQNLDDHKRDP